MNFYPQGDVRQTELNETHEMKRPIFALLLAALAFASCETAHKAAVSTYRVVAAPVTYVGHKLGVDEENQQTTTGETAVHSNTVANPTTQPYPVQQPSPPPPWCKPGPRSPRPRNSRHHSPTPQPTATPRVVQSEKPPPSNSPTPPASTVSQTCGSALRQTGSRQARLRLQSIRQERRLCRCNRIQSRTEGKGSLHGQDFSRAVTHHPAPSTISARFA